MIFAEHAEAMLAGSQNDRWFLLLNPEAGGGRGRKFLPEIEHALGLAGIEHTTHLTHAPAEAISLVQDAIAEGYRKIIAAGGDGTFHEIVNGILSQEEVLPAEITLGLIPIGTGNDWPRTWKIPRDITGAVKLIAAGNTCVQPAGLIRFMKDGREHKTWFANVAGCGFDAEVAAAANLAKMQGKSGVLTYIGQLTKTLFRYREIEAEIQINGESRKLPLFAVLAGIGRYAGQGMLLVPGADPASNQFSVTLAKKISRLKVILNLHRLFNGSFTKLSEVSQMQCDALEIRSSGKLLLQADGESIGEAPVSMQLFKEKIRLVVPA